MKQFNPYFVSDNEIYMTDGVAEVLIHTCENPDAAKIIGALLNDSYNGAYQDGYNASLREKHKELVNQNTSLGIENHMLKQKISAYHQNTISEK